MYCKYCGKEITDDSKFCSNCGKALNGSLTTELRLVCHEIWSKLLENKKLSYVCALWLTLNFALLLLGNDPVCYYPPAHYFYPEIGLGEISIYDIREFIFYAFLLPFAVWLVSKLHKCYKMKNHK